MKLWKYFHIKGMYLVSKVVHSIYQNVFRVNIITLLSNHIYSIMTTDQFKELQTQLGLLGRYL